MALKLNKVVIDDSRFSASELESVLWQRATQLADSASSTWRSSSNAQQLQQPILCFSVAGDQYALPAKQLVAVEQVQSLEELILVPDYVKGCLLSSGNLVGVVDLAQWWSGQHMEGCDFMWVLVVKSEFYQYGIIAESIDGYCHYLPEQVDKLPQRFTVSENELVGWIAKKNVALIDVDKLTVNLVETMNL